MLIAATGLAETLAKAAEPWANLYGDSKPVSAGVLFLHLAPLVFGAGAAFAMDRATIGAARATHEERARHLRALSAVHRVVLGGLALSFVSGVMLFLSDVETYWSSVFYWVKLALVGLLLANGFVMTRTEQSLAKSPDNAALWMRMRTLAILSAVLWLATTLAGVVLTEYA